MAATVYLEDKGDFNGSGVNSTFEQVWFSHGDNVISNVKSAIQAHASYLSTVTTADGYILNNLEWGYGNLTKSKKRVTITYSHQESRRNKKQNKVLQNVGDEETEITHGEISLPITESVKKQVNFGSSPDHGNRIEYNPVTREVKGTTRRRKMSRIRISKVYENSEIDNAWQVEREKKMFHLNEQEFRGRPAETVFFSGMNFRQQSKAGHWIVSFTFEHMSIETKDLTTLNIGSDATNQKIFPWRYYWALYREEPDNDAKELVPNCYGFYEAHLYHTTDFEGII